MKIKIDKGGSLWIQRKGTWKRQECRFSYYPDGECYCGDECPLFKEPVKNGNLIYLVLCKGMHVIEDSDFIDEREDQK